MNQKFKGVLLATDLDGTLLNSQHTVSPENHAAIAEFCAKGGRFTVVTGRSPKGFESMRDVVKVNAPVLMSNGAIGVDLQTGAVLWETPLTGAYREICQKVLNTYPDICLEMHRTKDVWAIQPNAECERHFTNTGMQGAFVRTLDEVPDSWLKAIFVGKTERLKVLSKELVGKYPFDFVFSTPLYLEMQNLDVNKGAGVLKLAEHLSIQPEHIYTAGDNENDAAMMAPFFSFAPANATPGILALANHKVAHCDAHAIADAIAFLEERYKG